PNGESVEVAPDDEGFTGFVFKIQANMDKRHRDRLAFLRITSGVFEKDMTVFHSRLGREVRMTRPHRLFARERETIDVAYPGDVIGFVNPGLFRIGDAVSSTEPLEFDRIPRFAPEHFAILRAKQVTSRARLTTDTHGHAVVLFASSWELDMAQKDNAGVEFLAAS